MNELNKFLVNWIIPPKIVDLLVRHSKKVTWSGDFGSWENATRNSTGYDSKIILEKVISATKKVVLGDGEYERDGVVFENKDYVWPLTSILLWISILNKNQITVLDFGGSLGSIFFQHKQFFEPIRLHWHIVEQESFVKAGRELFKQEQPKFFRSIQESQASSQANVLLLSSVIQYLEDPYRFLHQIQSYNIDFILIDKTTFFEDEGTLDIITVQTVKEPIYNASYPCWFFSKKKILEQFEEKYDLQFEFEYDGESKTGTKLAGMLLKRKNH